MGQLTHRALAVSALLSSITMGAHATEGGGTICPVGSENYACCALPPPGVYGMVFAQTYRADALKDNEGHTVPLSDFKVRASAIAPRLVWVTPLEVLGGSLAVHTIVPLVTLDVTVPGASQSKTGLGDIAFGPAIGWHLSPQLHTAIALDIFAPTGQYNKTDLANIGRNYWAMHLAGGITYMQPQGLNADAKVMYAINAKNSATDYRSGQELIIDYSIGWGVGNGWILGVGGYAYQQLTDDKQAGATVPNNKGRAFAIGPSIRYDSGKGWFLTLKYQQETAVRNRAEGKALWLKAVVPF